jgi:hypothetical protein
MRRQTLDLICSTHLDEYTGKKKVSRFDKSPNDDLNFSIPKKLARVSFILRLEINFLIGGS